MRMVAYKVGRRVLPPTLKFPSSPTFRKLSYNYFLFPPPQSISHLDITILTLPLRFLLTNLLIHLLLLDSLGKDTLLPSDVSISSQQHPHTPDLNI